MLTKKDIVALAQNDSLDLVIETTGKELDGYMTVNNAKLVASRKVSSIADPDNPWSMAEENEIRTHEFNVPVEIHAPKRSDKGKDYIGIAPAGTYEISVGEIESVWTTVVRQMSKDGTFAFEVILDTGTGLPKSHRQDSLYGKYMPKPAGEGKRGPRAKPYTYLLDVFTGANSSSNLLLPVEWFEYEEPQQEVASAD